jgi:hypothetical protein
MIWRPSRLSHLHTRHSTARHGTAHEQMRECPIIMQELHVFEEEEEEEEEERRT